MCTRFAMLPLFAALVVLLSAAPARADTVGTFADPTADGTTPLFTVSATTLSGGWSGTGLDLITPIAGQTFQDATFTMSDVTITGDQLGGGTLEFRASAADGGGPVLRIVFDGGELNAPFGFLAGGVSGNTVTFSGATITDTLADGAFSFSFANQRSTAAGTTYTAAFSSSATPQVSDGDGTGGDDDSSDGGSDGGTDGGTGSTPPPVLCGPLPCTTLALLPLSLLGLGWLKIGGAARARTRA